MLAAGLIDSRRAAIIADHTALLSDEHAVAVQDAVLAAAPRMTTGQLAAACRHAVAACDPEAAIRRRKEAEKDARVETWAEAAGTAALAGRDLAPASVIAADKTLDADARWLKAHGRPGGHDQLRADAMIARLTGQPLQALLPLAAGSGSAPARGVPAAGGSVNLTMPAAAWLGHCDAPGEVPGTGPADAGTCRDLAAALAASPATRWCVTAVDRQGRAVAHGCARDGPGPPASGDPAAWLATVKITPIETGTCQHRRESAGYQPSNLLRHLIKTRSRRCGFPGCRRPAVQCDDDHTIPYHQGGKTCECNLHPLCRRHHQTKQAPGWRLDQPEPGTLSGPCPADGRSPSPPSHTPAEPLPPQASHVPSSMTVRPAISWAGITWIAGGGCPAREHLQAVGCRGVCGCGVDEQGQAGVGGKLHGLEVEVEGADDGMVDAFAAGPVEADIVGGPPAAELLAASGQLADQLDELFVVGVAACLGSEHGGDVISGALPVGEELACGGIEVDEAGIVCGPARVGEDRGVEGAGEAVGGEHVVPGVAHPGRSVGDGIEDLLDSVRDAGRLPAPLPRRGGMSSARQVEQVGALGLVQLQRAGDSVEDGIGGAGQVPAFHADVVVDAYPGEQRDLLAPQPLDPAVASPVGGQPRLRG